MRISFHLKLVIGILIVFGLLFVGMALYLPVWFRIQRGRLESSGKAERESAAETIASRGRDAIPYIRKWLKSGYDPLITGACLVLEKMDGNTWKAALEELEAILDSAHSEKTDAVAMLFLARKYAFKLDPYESEIKFNRYKDKPVRQRNILLGILFKSRDEFFRYGTINTLVYNHKNTPGLFFYMKTVLFKDASDKVRTKATWALGVIGDTRAVEPLIEALKNDSDYDVREWVAFALGEIGDPRAIEPLIVALENDSDSEMRWRAADALGKIGDKCALEPLIKALENDSDYEVRLSAAGALSEIGDYRAVKPLIKALENDSDSTVRWQAAGVLGKIGDTRALEPLIKALEKDSDSGVRGEAAVALGEIGGPRALEPLIKALENDSNSGVRWWAAIALGKIGGSRALEPLIKAFENDSESNVRRWAADALGEIGDPRAIKPLIGALENDSDSSVRESAADALGEIGDIRAIEPLVTALENDLDSNVRERSAVALAGFECARVRDALEAARDRKNKCAAIALAWQSGGDELESAGKLKIRKIKYGVFGEFLAHARARWGDKNAVETSIHNLPALYYTFRRFHADVFSRMPAGFPEFDFKANYATRKKQAAAIKAWYEKNKARLAWDKNKRRYYLRDGK
jgi:HEAT repeat protein